jgi:SARP family transcriptional regulator, regulator of embCAB operon
MLEHGLVRALDVLATAGARAGDASLAGRAAEEAVGLAPYRESGYRALMRVHLLAGDRAEAVRAFTRLKALLAEELGVDPAPETVALYREALRTE